MGEAAAVHTPSVWDRLREGLSGESTEGLDCWAVKVADGSSNCLGRTPDRACVFNSCVA
jgi:hypothetical protein